MKREKKGDHLCSRGKADDGFCAHRKGKTSFSSGNKKGRNPLFLTRALEKSESGAREKRKGEEREREVKASGGGERKVKRGEWRKKERGKTREV